MNCFHPEVDCSVLLFSSLAIADAGDGGIRRRRCGALYNKKSAAWTTTSPPAALQCEAAAAPANTSPAQQNLGVSSISQSEPSMAKRGGRIESSKTYPISWRACPRSAVKTSGGELCAGGRSRTRRVQSLLLLQRRERASPHSGSLLALQGGRTRSVQWRQLCARTWLCAFTVHLLGSQPQPGHMCIAIGA